MTDSNASESRLTTHRIEALTDGIYAIAMTLLVLNLALPEVGTYQAAVPLHDALFEQAHKFFNYALSFILLAVFWIIHHDQFHFITRTNRTLLWINIFCLMFVALVPFTTSLSGDFPDETIAKLFFDLNLFILGLLNSLNWVYATKGYRLVDRSMDPKRIASGTKRGMVTPSVALLAMGLSIITPLWSSCAYLLIPVLLAHPRFRHETSAET